MDKIKEFFILFWSSTFNKVWLVLVGLAIAFVSYGYKNAMFTKGWKRFLPVIIAVALGVAFLAKKFILQKTMPQTGKR